MRILVACEFSGIVREAFRRRGHDAWSCDLIDTEIPGQHIKDDVGNAINFGRWDMLIAFPPCTYLACSGARWNKFGDRRRKQITAVMFVKSLMKYHPPLIAVENPIGVLSTQYRKPDQIVQPWMFGHGETKATCLWLRGLPKLAPTDIVDGRIARVHREPPGPDRWKNRSRTYQGIADAMAEQWGVL